MPKRREIGSGCACGSSGFMKQQLWISCVPALDFSRSYPVFCHAYKRQNPGMNATMAKMEREGPVRLLAKADTLIGSLLCGSAAAVVSVVAAGHGWRVVVPLVFTVVLLLIAAIFGLRAGVWGTLIATLVFASLLFTPLGSMRVSSEAARANLGWMMLIGLGFSLLFAPPTSTFRRR
jgi:K+-sensing histidine kinase KdpD